MIAGMETGAWAAAHAASTNDPTSFWGEAAAAIGLGRRDALVHVVLPQAVRLVLPSLILALVSLLKDSTLGYVVSFNELQFQGKTLVSITRYLVQTYLVVSAIYIVINLVLTRIALALDARMKARAAAS